VHGDTAFMEEYQAACIEAAWRAIVDAGVAGGVLWCWANYYHRRDFISEARYRG
jgi:beta-glucuronidase